MPGSPVLSNSRKQCTEHSACPAGTTNSTPCLGRGACVAVSSPVFRRGSSQRETLLPGLKAGDEDGGVRGECDGMRAHSLQIHCKQSAVAHKLRVYVGQALWPV